MKQLNVKTAVMLGCLVSLVGLTSCVRKPVSGDFCMLYEAGSDLSVESEGRNYCTFICDCGVRDKSLTKVCGCE